MKLLPQMIENPKYILKLDNGRINLLSETSINGNTKLISIELNSVKNLSKEMKKYNVVATVFEPKINYLINLFKKEGTEVLYENRGAVASDTPAVQYPASINDNSSGEDILTQDTDVVKNNIANNIVSDEVLKQAQKDLEILTKEYGMFTEGEKAARNIEVPKKTTNNENVRRYVRTAAEGTRAGQVVQAMRLLKKMDGVGQLMYIENVVKNLQNDLIKTHGKKTLHFIREHE
ncbi:MAG: hypothetical protein SOZ34_08760 [Clostridia bacterium]|nr:hypothetical protein [Clostridia bacterium]